MTERATSRRAFLRLGLGRAASVADELLGMHLPWSPDDDGDASAPSDASVPRAVGPPLAQRTLTVAEALECARGEGLGGRLEAVRRHLRTSLRLSEVPAATQSGSWLWVGAPSTSDGAWPAGREVPLVGLCHLDLEHLHRAGFEPPLPPRGGMSVWIDDRTARVVVRDDDALATAFARGPNARPAVLTPELVLPRVWVSSVQALDLAAEETEAWARLRSLLAARQGVTLFDEVDDPLALHRVGGYADERVDLSPVPAGDWELLLQVTVLGTPVGSQRHGEPTRVHLWIESSALARADFADVRITSL